MRTASAAPLAGTAALLTGICLALAACGDDDEPAQTSERTTTQTTPDRDSATATQPDPPAETEQAPPPEEPAPEDQPGGAGDEEAIRTEARLTGSGGRVRPTEVSVPPFIGVRVFLRSTDGGEYGLSCAGRRVQVDREVEAASTTLPGRPIGSVVPCRPLGDHNAVVIRFSAEPGP